MFLHTRQVDRWDKRIIEISRRSILMSRHVGRCHKIQQICRRALPHIKPIKSYLIFMQNTNSQSSSLLSLHRNLKSSQTHWINAQSVRVWYLNCTSASRATRRYITEGSKWSKDEAQAPVWVFLQLHLCSLVTVDIPFCKLCRISKTATAKGTNMGK